MTVAYNYKKGIDLPAWHQLPFAVVPSYHGSSNAYDGKRYMYWVIQYGTTAATASTTGLFRFDTWSNAWQNLATTTSGNQGVDVEYDSIRNVLYIIHGASLTSWQVFNLNTTAITVANVACPAFALTTMTPVLPAIAALGASLTMPSDDAVPTIIDEGIADATGNTTLVIKATDATGTFGQGMIGLQVKVTSGAQINATRIITAVSDKNTLTLSAVLTAALATGDTYIIQEAQGTSSAIGTTTTFVDSVPTWAVNFYTNHDLVITSGALAGQRRRIASNTANTLTLAAAVTGNARTGALASAPAAGVTYMIVPSQDFLYFQAGNGTAFYKIDVAQTTGAAWSGLLAAAPGAIAGGGNTFYPAAYAPYMIVALRGSVTNNFYYYNIGLNTWSTQTVFSGIETFTTGAGAAMATGKRKLIIQKEGTTRLHALDLLTGILEPCGTQPYAAPALYDGKRLRVVTTADGAQFLYILRPGGQEFYRVALEWL